MNDPTKCPWAAWFLKQEGAAPDKCEGCAVDPVCKYQAHVASTKGELRDSTQPAQPNH